LSQVGIRVKSNAHYLCQECGSTEQIQAHHQIPGDDSSLSCLCADCHSKKHPNLPRALFFNKRLQPYWFNKSASSIAKELGVHPRTVIRAARVLNILPGTLSPWDDWLIRVNIPKMHRHKSKRRERPLRTCPRCAYTWRGKKDSAWNTTCPRCNQFIIIGNCQVSEIREEHQVPLIP